MKKRSKHWKDLKLTRPELQRSNCDKICEIPNMKIHSGNTNLEHFSIHSPPSLQVSLSIKFRLWNIFAKIAKLSKAAFFQRPQQSFSISPGPTEIKIKSVTIFFLLKMKLKRKWNLRIVLPSKVFLLTKEQTTRMTLNENCYEFFASRSQILWAVIFSFFPSLLQNNRCKSRENRNFFLPSPPPKCQRNHVFFT